MNDDNICVLLPDNYKDFGNSSNEMDNDEIIEILRNVDEEKNLFVDPIKHLAFRFDDELETDNDDHKNGSILNDTRLKYSFAESDDSLDEYHSSIGQKSELQTA